MPAIRYVCLSDLHLGADNSILTAIKPGSIETDPSRPSAVLLIDEALETVSVRMYNQATNPRDYAVRVEGLSSSDTAQSAFLSEVNASVTDTRDPWKTFSAVVAEAVGAHEQLLRTKINL